MASVPFPLRLKADLRERLEAAAVREDRSADELVSEALEGFLNAQDYKRLAIEAALAEADRGVFISAEAVHKWMESWDTDHELPPPEPDIFLPPRR